MGFKTYLDLKTYLEEENIPVEKYFEKLNIEQFNRLISQPTFWQFTGGSIHANFLLNELQEPAKVTALANIMIRNDLSITLDYLSSNEVVFVVLDIIFENWNKIKNKNSFWSYALNYNSEMIKKYIEFYIAHCIDGPQKSRDQKIENMLNAVFNRNSTKYLILGGFYPSPNTNIIETDDSLLWTVFILKKLLELRPGAVYNYFKKAVKPLNSGSEDSYKKLTLEDKEKIVFFLFLITKAAAEVKKITEPNNEKHILDIFSKVYNGTELISILNSVAQHSDEYREYILQSPTLIRFIKPTTIINADYTSSRQFSGETEKNLVKNFDCKTLSKIFKTECSYEFDLKRLLKKYFSYEKAIFILSILRISENDKKNIIYEIYGVRCNNIEEEKNNLINKAIQCILSNQEPVPNFFIDILPDLIALPYTPEIFDKFKKILLTVSEPKYLQVIMAQIFKKSCIEKKLKVEDYHLFFSPHFKRLNGLAWHDGVVEILQRTNEEDPLNPSFNINSANFQTLNHETTHSYQNDIMPSQISIDSLMVAFSKILSCDKKYYDDNYWNMYHEIHARVHGFYETYKLIKENDPSSAKWYALRPFESFKNDRRIFVSNGSKFQYPSTTGNFWYSRSNRVSDKKNSVIYFTDLINTFFEKVSASDIVYWRKKYKSLELITNEQGIPYTPEEIEGFINNFKASDLKYDATNKAIYTFYIRYLHLLTDGLNLSDGKINIYDETTLRRRFS